MTKSRQGQGRYWEAAEDRLGRLVDDDAEVEYLFIKSHGSLHCRVDKLIPVSGQTDVFLKIFPMRQEPRSGKYLYDREGPEPEIS